MQCSGLSRTDLKGEEVLGVPACPLGGESVPGRQSQQFKPVVAILSIAVEDPIDHHTESGEGLRRTDTSNDGS